MKKYTKIICLIAAVCLLGTAAFCGFRIYSHYAHESEQEEVFEKIAEVVEQAQTGESETTDVLLTEEETVLAEYGELYLQNTDMVGWLSIAGTNINYPVMQTPNNPNYYLKHNFEKEYSDLGTPYVQENCDLLTSDNLVIYGHHIKGQKMFGALENYKSKDFYEEHKTFRFDTLTKRGEYEIIAVFKTVAYSSAGFRYYDFVNAEDENDFDGRVEWCACFVSWCANECGYIESGVIPKFAGCANGVQWFKDRGQWQDNGFEPSAGQIIFFDWECDGEVDHVGIVEKCESGIVYTVEGNSGDACRQKQYAVGRSVIYGYGIPAY